MKRISSALKKTMCTLKALLSLKTPYNYCFYLLILDKQTNIRLLQIIKGKALLLMHFYELILCELKKIRMNDFVCKVVGCVRV